MGGGFGARSEPGSPRRDRRSTTIFVEWHLSRNIGRFGVIVQSGRALVSFSVNSSCGLLGDRASIVAVVPDVAARITFHPPARLRSGFAASYPHDQVLRNQICGST